jgi:DMSO/TMAO reductase YedYZ molybdopterin-dependent catalytic subunit
MRETYTMTPFTRGFRRRHPEAPPGVALPPGQYLTDGFPVLSAGPTPDVPLEEWEFSVTGSVDEPRKWSWEEFQALPKESITVDIHCVTSWSKLGTGWEGVSVDTLLDGIDLYGAYSMVHSYGGYTTNLAIEDITDGKAWVAYAYDGEPLEPEHGGPARLLVPHLYFWKSAKWVRGIEVMDYAEPGFWESLGYHDRGDPWREQRYQGD